MAYEAQDEDTSLPAWRFIFRRLIWLLLPDPVHAIEVSPGQVNRPRSFLVSGYRIDAGSGEPSPLLSANWPAWNLARSSLARTAAIPSAVIEAD